MSAAKTFVHSRGRIALTRELADVQEALADMGNLQEFAPADKQRWNELKSDEGRLWRAIQALNGSQPILVLWQQN